MTLFSHTVATSDGGSYPVLLGAGVSSRLPGFVRATGASRAVVIADSNLERLHAPSLLPLAGAGGRPADLLSFPAGETSKTRAVKEELEDRMVELGCGRDTVVVALGGGVTGDLAGFTAATYMRGLPWVQLPTSLLAMADASVGGKTGVDHPRGKNLIGAFHHPVAVLADLDLLATLPKPEFISGLAEVVKAGMVGDASLLELLESLAPRLASGEAAAVGEPLSRAVAVKAAVVSEDDLEGGRRKVLNFGHTLGHALERATGYRTPHGAAVAVGMCLEARIAVRRGLLEEAESLRLARLLDALGLPTELPPGAPSPRELLEASATDKKARRGRLELALPQAPGRMARVGGCWTIPVDDGEILEVLSGGGPGGRGR